MKGERKERSSSCLVDTHTIPSAPLCPPALLIGWMYKVDVHSILFFFPLHLPLSPKPSLIQPAEGKQWSPPVIRSSVSLCKHPYADRQPTSSPGSSKNVSLRQLSGMSRGQRQKAKERRKSKREQVKSGEELSADVTTGPEMKH